METPVHHPSGNQQQIDDQNQSSIKKKNVHIAAALALVVLSIGTGVWWYYRIVSDVPVFAPPEWVWLDGDVEVMVFPDSDELLIHRTLAATRDKSRVPHYVIEAGELAKHQQYFVEQRRYGEAFKQQQFSQEALDAEAGAYESYFNKKQNERNTLRGLTGGSKLVSGASGLRKDYYYRYDSSTEKLQTATAISWSTANGIVTKSDVYRQNNSLMFQVGNTSLPRDEFYKKLGAIRTAPKIFKIRGLWRIATPPVMACSPRPTMVDKGDSVKAAACYLNRREVLTGMVSKARMASVYMSQDRRAWRPGFVHFPGGPAPAISGRQHFVRFISLPDVKDVGMPVRISMVTDLYGKVATPERDILLDMVWSADSQFVVFVGLTSLAIVDVEALADTN